VALDAKVCAARASRAIFAGAPAVEGDAFVERSAFLPAQMLTSAVRRRRVDRNGVAAAATLRIRVVETGEIPTATPVCDLDVAD